MSTNKINFAFFGTPDVASDTLEILKQAGHLPSLIVTSPDAKAGRKMLFSSSPAKTWAEKNKIKYVQSEKELDISIYDLAIVVAYGKILPEKILNAPKFGSINIHYSLLPKYRGASPVETAILNGETETGVTIQKMVYELDAGAIIAQEKTQIGTTELAHELRKRLIKIGGELLVKTLPDLMEGKIKETPQDDTQATFSKKIKKEDGLIDLNDDPIKNYNKFRAYATWPRTFFFKDERRMVITDAALEDNKFVIKKVIPEGKKEIDYKN